MHKILPPKNNNVVQQELQCKNRRALDSTSLGFSRKQRYLPFPLDIPVCFFLLASIAASLYTGVIPF